MKSLLLIGFPRGFTSQAYDIAKEMLPFLKESGIDAGEVLNQTRNTAIDRDIPFYLKSNTPDFEETYQYCRKILDQYTEGYIIKEVVQPFIVLRYLFEHPNAFNVLFVNRPLEHIQFSLDRKGWGFAGKPETLYPAFSSFPALDVNKAYYEPQYVHQCLQAIYPKATPYNYLSPLFIEQREKFLSDFKNDHWHNTYRSIKNLPLFTTQNISNSIASDPLAWTTALEARVDIHIPADTPRFNRLHLKTFLSAGFQEQPLKVSFTVEGVTHQHCFTKIREETLVMIPLGKSIERQALLTLHINNEAVTQPSESGLSRDTRTLGVGLSAVGLFNYDESQEAKPGNRLMQLFNSAYRRLIS